MHEFKTKTEELIFLLARNSFLGFWVFPNTFWKKGSEFCDLIVVFNKTIILFEIYADEKEKTWARHKNNIDKKMGQVVSSSNKLLRQTNKIYSDSECKQEISIDFQKISEFKIHRIVISFRKNELSQFKIDTTSDNLKLNTINSFFSYKNKKDFVHVFDGLTFDYLSNELNTIEDFVQYLNWREFFLKKNSSIIVNNEKDMICYFLGRNIFNLEPLDSPIITKEGKINFLTSDFFHEINFYKTRYTEWQHIKKSSQIIDNIINNSHDKISADAYINAQEIEEPSTQKNIEHAFKKLASFNRVRRFQIVDLICKRNKGIRLTKASFLFIQLNDLTIIFSSLRSRNYTNEKKYYKELELQMFIHLNEYIKSKPYKQSILMIGLDRIHISEKSMNFGKEPIVMVINFDNQESFITLGASLSADPLNLNEIKFHDGDRIHSFFSSNNIA